MYSYGPPHMAVQKQDDDDDIYTLNSNQEINWLEELFIMRVEIGNSFARMLNPQGWGAYQPSWVIYCLSHPCRRTVVVLFNLQLVVIGGSCLSQGCLFERERKSVNGIRTQLQRYHNQAR